MQHSPTPLAAETTIDRISRKVDSAFPMKNRGIWIVTIVIIVLGALLVLIVLRRPDRQRTARMERVLIGNSAQRASEALGIAPLFCDPGPLEHLRGSFPEGWPPAAVDVALERLSAEIGERWVYPIEAGEQVGCSGSEPRTEIGVAADGTIVWSVAVVGRTTLELPPWLTPGGTAEAADSI